MKECSCSDEEKEILVAHASVGCEKELTPYCWYYRWDSSRLSFILRSIVGASSLWFHSSLCFSLHLCFVQMSTYSELHGFGFLSFGWVFWLDPAFPLFFLIQSLMSVINMQFDLKKISIRRPWSWMNSNSNFNLFFWRLPFFKSFGLQFSFRDIRRKRLTHAHGLTIVISFVECGTSRAFRP